MPHPSSIARWPEAATVPSSCCAWLADLDGRLDVIRPLATRLAPGSSG